MPPPHGPRYSQPPEAYIYLLSISSPPLDARKTPLLALKSEERRILPLLDALALLCVSDSRDEAYAFGIQMPVLPNSSLTLFMAGNHVISPGTREHLHFICLQLHAISQLREASPTRATEEDLSVTLRHLGTSVFRFCLPEILRRLKQRPANWANAKAGVHYLLQQGENEGQFHKWCQFTQLIDVLYTAALQDPQKSIEMHQELWTLAGSAHGLLRGDVELQNCLKNLVKFPELRPIGEFVEQVIAHPRCVHLLASLAASRTLRPFFSRLPSIVYLEPSPKEVVTNTKAIRQELPSFFDGDPLVTQESLDVIPERYENTAHCELTLAAYMATHLRPGSYSRCIGCSNDVCFGCEIALLAIAAPENEDGGVSFLAMRYSRRMKSKYVLPPLSVGIQQIITENAVTQLLTESKKSQLDSESIDRQSSSSSLA